MDSIEDRIKFLVEQLEKYRQKLESEANDNLREVVKANADRRKRSCGTLNSDPTPEVDNQDLTTKK